MPIRWSFGGAALPLLITFNQKEITMKEQKNSGGP